MKLVDLRIEIDAEPLLNEEQMDDCYDDFTIAIEEAVRAAFKTYINPYVWEPRVTIDGDTVVWHDPS